MDSLIRIDAVKPEGDDGLIVTFSDGTTTAYVTEELLALRPCREPIELYPTKTGLDLPAALPPLQKSTASTCPD